MGAGKTVMSFARGLQVLETLSLAFRPLTLTEIAGRLNLNLAATQRFLNTLCASGYAHRDAAKGYRLSSKVLSLGLNFLGGSPLCRLAGPVLETLHAEVGETVNLSVLDGLEIVHLARREGSSVLKYNLGPGSRLPAHCTSTGKMLLSGMGSEELRVLLSKGPLAAVTPRTITSVEKLIREIDSIRGRGYSLCDRELSMDLYSIAVPLLDEKGGVVASVNVTTGCVGIEAKKQRIIAKLLQAGEELSKLLGYSGPYPRTSGAQGCAEAPAAALL